MPNAYGICKGVDAGAFAVGWRGHIKGEMRGIWVLFELIPLAALMLLVCFAVCARAKEPAGLEEGAHPAADSPFDARDDYVEPEWWPEFEREFARYVARTASTGKAGTATPSRGGRASPGRSSPP
jgi:hypothetical protein